jgi:hypothetical protein
MEHAFLFSKYGDYYNPNDSLLEIVRLQVYSTLSK